MSIVLTLPVLSIHQVYVIYILDKAVQHNNEYLIAHIFQYSRYKSALAQCLCVRPNYPDHGGRFFGNAMDEKNHV